MPAQSTSTKTTNGRDGGLRTPKQCLEARKEVPLRLEGSRKGPPSNAGNIRSSHPSQGLKGNDRLDDECDTNLGKLSISRRRISAPVSPVASPLSRHKECSEKENITLEDTPLRHVRARPASGTIRKKPLPQLGPGKNNDLKLVSKTSQLSMTVKPSSGDHTQASTTDKGTTAKARPRPNSIVIPKTQSVLTSMTKPKMQTSSNQNIGTKRSSFTLTRSSTLPKKLTQPSIAKAASYCTEVSPSNTTPKVPSVTATPCSPWSPSALRKLFSVTECEPELEPLQLEDISARNLPDWLLEPTEDLVAIQFTEKAPPTTPLEHQPEVYEDDRLLKAKDTTVEDSSALIESPVLTSTEVQQASTNTCPDSSPGGSNSQEVEATTAIFTETLKLSDNTGFEVVLPLPSVYSVEPIGLHKRKDTDNLRNASKGLQSLSENELIDSISQPSLNDQGLHGVLESTVVSERNMSVEEATNADSSPTPMPTRADSINQSPTPIRTPTMPTLRTSLFPLLLRFTPPGLASGLASAYAR
ncbi:hypothetical protein EW145_g7320, partial [Phellinidium pouzarii]